MKEMSSKIWYGELGRAFLAMVVRKDLSVKVTFEQTWKRRENEPILWRAERKRAKALRQKDKLQVWGTESKLIWLEPSEMGGWGEWLEVLEGLEGVR